jgi:Flp pilus assembly protein TadB
VSSPSSWPATCSPDVGHDHRDLQLPAEADIAEEAAAAADRPRMNDIRTRELEALRSVIRSQAGIIVSRNRLIMALATLALFQFVAIIALVLEASAVICFAIGAVVGVVVVIGCWWAFIRWG